MTRYMPHALGTTFPYWTPHVVIRSGAVLVSYPYWHDAHPIAAELGGVALSMVARPGLLLGQPVLLATHPAIAADQDRALVQFRSGNCLRILPRHAMECEGEYALRTKLPRRPLRSRKKPR